MTWLGVLILGSALAHSVVPSAVASTTGVSSATTSFSSIDGNQGIFTGGHRRDFTTGIQGFGQGVFRTVGSLALERTLGEDEIQRDEYQGSASSVAVNQGGSSTWHNIGMFFPRQDQTLLLSNTVGLTGDTATWSTRVESLLSGSMDNNRIVWEARLAESFVPVYTTQAGGVVLVSDSSGTHPALVMKATSTAGELIWGGSGGFSNPLTPGSRTPTVYVHSVQSADFTISVVVTLLDHDPCSTAAALTLAGQVAGVVGSTSPTITSCLGAATWTASAGETTTLSLSLGAPARELSGTQTRVLQIGGLPHGATSATISGTNSSLVFDLDVSDTTELGGYELSVVLLTATSVGGVEIRSEPFTSAAHLTITAIGMQGPVEDPVGVVSEDDTGGREVSNPPLAPSANSPAPSPTVTSEAPATREGLRGVTFGEGAGVEPLLTPVIPLPTTPPETSFGPVPRPFEKSVVVPPTPALAGTLLGASMAGALALGSVVALLRRRRSQARE